MDSTNFTIGRTNFNITLVIENEGQALNVLAYGDVVEQVIGSTRHIIAKKIEITATEELILRWFKSSNSGAG